MKKYEFEDAAIDILGKKWYDTFNGRISKIAETCAVELFMIYEINTKRALIVRDILEEFNAFGCVKWEKEDETEQVYLYGR